MAVVAVVCMYACKWVGYLHDGRAQHLAQGGVDEHLHTYIHTSHTNIGYREEWCPDLVLLQQRMVLGAEEVGLRYSIG